MFRRSIAKSTTVIESKRALKEPQFPRRRMGRKYLLTFLLFCLVFWSFLTLNNGLPWGGKATSCTMKELRDRFGKDMEVLSKESLSARTEFFDCQQNEPIDQINEKVIVSFLIWQYTGPDVRLPFAKTNARKTPRVTEECKSWCTIQEANREEDLKDSDLVFFSASDHGRAYGVSWCNYPYPEPFVHHVNMKYRSRFRDPMQRIRPQYWGTWTFEQIKQFPMLADPFVTKHVDLTMNFRQDADIPITWFCPEEGPPNFRNYYKPIPDDFLSLKTNLLVTINSRCRNDWMEYVQELSSYLPSHKFVKFGSCWRDGGMLPLDDEGAFYNKILEISKSKFVLTFENNKGLNDWVTEKISHAFLAETVPIYWGAPNIQDYLPGNHSAIIVTGTELERSPKALADLLLYLDNNENEYLKYFSWKKSLNEKFMNQSNRCLFHAGCRICEWVRKRRTCQVKQLHS